MRLPQVRRRVDASVAERKTDAHSALGLIPKPLLGSGLADRDDGDTCPTPARIDIWRGHRATLEPVVPGVREYLTRVVIEFDASGPLGDRMRPTRSTYLAPVVPHTQLDGDGVIRPDAQVLSQGLVPGVRVWLEELGYRVEVHDRRKDSERWVQQGRWKERVAKENWKVTEAVAEHRALRVVLRGDDRIADTVAAVARAHPCARIAVAVPTYKLLDRIAPRLKSRIDEPLGLYTARKKRPGRVAVGLIGQFPRGDKGDWDLLVLPYAESTVGDNALRIITSGQYRRILAFTPRRWTSDENTNQRLLVVAEHVWPEERERVPVTTVILETHGTRPTVEKLNAFEEKKLLYWCNTRRNHRIAEVARCLMRRTKKAVRSVVGDEQLAAEIVCAAKTGVAILVESLVHARELALLLPGWVIWNSNELTAEKPKRKCGVITTERAAHETVVSAGVLIRATGTKWKLPEIDWPWMGDVEQGFLIDFADEYHPLAARNAKLRMTEYAENGRIVTVMKGKKSATKHHETTGASGRSLWSE